MVGNVNLHTFQYVSWGVIAACSSLGIFLGKKKAENDINAIED